MKKYQTERRLVCVCIVLLLVDRVLYLSLVNLNTIPHPRELGTFLPAIAVVCFVIVNGLRLGRLRPILHAWTHWLTWGIMSFSLFCLTMGLYGIGAVSKQLNESLFNVCLGFALFGSFMQTLCSTFLNAQVWLLQPVWLQFFRIGLTSLLVCAAIVFVATVGWHNEAVKWGQFFQIVLTTLYFATYGHESEFPHRSRCPFVNFADSPPCGYILGEFVCTCVCVGISVFVCTCTRSYVCGEKLTRTRSARVCDFSYTFTDPLRSCVCRHGFVFRDCDCENMHCVLYAVGVGFAGCFIRSARWQARAN